MPTVQIKLADRLKIQLAPVGDQNATQVATVQFRPVAQDPVDVVGNKEGIFTFFAKYLAARQFKTPQNNGFGSGSSR